MKVRCKYKVGSTVFFIWNNEVRSGNVVKIEVIIKSKTLISTGYHLDFPNTKYPFSEIDVFNNIDDLLENLKESYNNN